MNFRHMNINKLKELDIKIKNFNDMYILKYSATSPKEDSIVKQCRGLIVDLNFNVISRPFDRFFNLGEVKVEIPKYIRVVEKIDGSLIKIYYYNYQWHVSTSSNAVGNNEVGTTGFTYADLVKPFLNKLQNLDKDYTHIFELTSPYNKVVVNYGKEVKLWYLNSRHNQTGKYRSYRSYIKHFNKDILFPYEFVTNDLNNVYNYLNNKTELHEGVVLYNDSTLVPIVKIKQPEYIKLHRLRGNDNINLKTAIELYLTNEHLEYLTYFPEHSQLFKDINDKYSDYLNKVRMHLYKYNIHNKEVRKEIGLTNIESTVKYLLFESIKNPMHNIENAFYNLNLETKIKLIEKQFKK